MIPVLPLIFLLFVCGCSSLMTYVVQNDIPDRMRPSNERSWSPEFNQLPDIELVGNQVIVRNVRNNRYISEKDFVLIGGTDILPTFHKWKNYKVLLGNFKLYIYNRPGYNAGEYDGHPNISFFEAPLLEISASFSRHAIKTGKDIKYMLDRDLLKMEDVRDAVNKGVLKPDDIEYLKSKEIPVLGDMDQKEDH